MGLRWGSAGIEPRRRGNSAWAVPGPNRVKAGSEPGLSWGPAEGLPGISQGSDGIEPGLSRGQVWAELGPGRAQISSAGTINTNITKVTIIINIT